MKPFNFCRKMLSQLFSLGGEVNLGVLALLLLCALWLWHAKRHGFVGAPPTFPYIFPFLGSLPIEYLFNPRAFVLNQKNFFQSKQPMRVKILHKEFYIINGADNVKALFKSSWACTSIPFVKFALGHAFGLSAKALSLFDKDDRNRIDYHVHESLVRFLEGKGLLPFWNRFTDTITQRLHAMHDRVGSDWDYHTDLMQLVGDEATISIINALCGPYFLALSPDFLRSFWNFDRNLQVYLRGTPWFLAPQAYADRKKVLDAVKTWQQHARDHFTQSAIGADGDDPFWGCSFFRERQKMFLNIGFDYAAIVSQDFGAIWASRNAAIATSWAIFDLYRDPELLASVRAEIDTCRLKSDIADGHVRFDIDKLCRLPVLQAVYAETLRLRMHFYIIRMSDRVDLKIQDWVIPRRKVIVTPTTVAHMDSKVWNTGVNNEHPAHQFWAGRFLKRPMGNTHEASKDASVTFSTKEVEGSWIPYGGGPRQCPGRHFAKREILLTVALMVSLFDCEILGKGMDIQEDFSLSGFGGGISHPDGNVPARIRRRTCGAGASLS